VRPAVIFDRDGTLFSVDGPTDQSSVTWANYNARIRFDAPVPMIHALWHAIRPGVDRIVVSGRDGAFAHAMRDSFAKHGIVPDAFFHRRANDHRRDSIVKEEILDGLILPRWDVRFVVDDRQQVVDMWRSRGIPVLQVTDPKISPPILTRSLVQ
jgi:hypothetical protein